MIAFHLPITPPKATSQGAGKRMVIVKGKPMFFKNKAAASAEHDYLTLCAPHAPHRPLDGAVALKVDFVFPWRKSEPRKRRALGRVPMTTKPDLSNAIKALEDCLTKLGFWEDDGQVADLHITKAWGDHVGINITLHPIN
jgi:Holliday junction resolvase RusA-like endonuclease